MAVQDRPGASGSRGLRVIRVVIGLVVGAVLVGSLGYLLWGPTEQNQADRAWLETVCATAADTHDGADRAMAAAEKRNLPIASALGEVAGVYEAGARRVRELPSPHREDVDDVRTAVAAWLDQVGGGYAEAAPLARSGTDDDVSRALSQARAAQNTARERLDATVATIADDGASRIIRYSGPCRDLNLPF